MPISKSKKVQNNVLNVFSFTQNEKVQLRTETISGVAYTIVPVVMMTVGVHEGSGGALLYTDNELSEFYQAWNGVPVSVQHPQIDGIYVSANMPDIYETQVIGKIFNTVYEDGKLKAEAWLETGKSADIIAMLKSGVNLEVSTGLFSNYIPTPGNYNGEEYDAIATEIRPDHLALLPGTVGCMSIFG